MAEILTFLKKDYTLKTVDIIEVSIKWEVLFPEEDPHPAIINPNDYDNKYNICYAYPKKTGHAEVDILEKAGTCSFADIVDYIGNYIKDDIPKIKEYKLFDVNNKGEYQKAKLKYWNLNKGE